MLGISILIVVLAFQVSGIQGTSMAPALMGPGLVLHRPLPHGQVHRGDIVSFKANDQYFLKRVIGLPGETITIAGGSVYVQPMGTTQPSIVQEPYLAPGVRTYATIMSDAAGSQYTVPSDAVFVLADKRSGGSDSRSFRQDKYLDTDFVPVSAIRSRLVAFAGTSGIWLFTAAPKVEIHPIPAGLIPYCPQDYPCRIGQWPPTRPPESVE